MSLAAEPATGEEVRPTPEPPPTEVVSRSEPTKVDRVETAEPSEQPFQPNLEYLDPTHDNPVRFSGASVRCGRAQANCLPIPYNGDPKLVVGADLKSHYEPSAKRTPVKGFRADAGTNLCSHDGECLSPGGVRCIRWDTDVSGNSTLLWYDELADAYCGCVQKQCQWFTQPRPKIHLEFKSVKLDGWPKRLPVNRDEIDLAMNVVIQDEIRRCFVNHLKQLPRRIVFSVEQKRDSDQQTGNVKGAPAKVAGCLEQLAPSVSVSLRDVTDPELARHPITFEATIDVSVRTVP